MIAYTIKDAARQVGYEGETQIRELITAKKLKAVRLTPKGALRVRHIDLMEYVNSLTPAEPRKDDQQ